MYEYRNASLQKRAQLLKHRLKQGHPKHQPPHLIQNRHHYLLTAACFEHAHFINTSQRRLELLGTIFDQSEANHVELHAWAVLSNHYHLLVYVEQFSVIPQMMRRIHGRTSAEWNRQDNLRGRKVWYRYADRAIRSERHYYTVLNYIHYNPVKHGYVRSPYDWEASSVHWHLEQFGRDTLRVNWSKYPVGDMGRAWDEF